MKIGIVGAEAAKFTPLWRFKAFRAIRDLMYDDCDTVVSGACPLGGVDSWAEQVARERGKAFIEHKPVVNSWDGVGGFRDRNRLIAESSDRVVCIVVRRLPDQYRGRKFALCYHCKCDDHVKSGGCWTAWEAVKLGKIGELIIIGDVAVVRRNLVL
jgi:hypothetical protein